MIAVSVIIPVYNSAHLISNAIESVLQQSYGDWEIVVIDDGSTDAIEEVMETYQQKEKRIRLYHQENAGVSAARNFGIEKSKYDWLLFMDADDFIHEDFFSKMISVIENDSSVDAVRCRWRRVLAEGRLSKEIHGEVKEDLFAALARSCPLIIHSCLVRKKSVEEIGGFDIQLKNCGDWDFWQRLARSHAKFFLVNEALAFYRIMPVSLSSNINQVCINGLRVIERGYQEDNRVPHPREEYRNGLLSNDLNETKYYFITWLAGKAIGSKQDPAFLLEHLKVAPAENLNADLLAEFLLDACLLPRAKMKDDWLELWDELNYSIASYLERLEAQTSAKNIAEQTIDRMLCQIASDAIEQKNQLQIGNVFAKQIDVEERFQDIFFSGEIEKFIALVRIRDIVLGKIDLKVSQCLHASTLKKMIAEKFSWQILKVFFEATIYCQFEPGADLQALHDEKGWEIFLQQFWNRPHWTEAMFFDENSVEEKKPCVRLKKSILYVDLGEELPDIKTLSSALQIIYSIAGVEIGSISVLRNKKMISAQMIRAAIGFHSGFELCKAAVRELLIGEPVNNGMNLFQRLKAKAKPTQSLLKIYQPFFLKRFTS